MFGFKMTVHVRFLQEEFFTPFLLALDMVGALTTTKPNCSDHYGWETGGVVAAK